MRGNSASKNVYVAVCVVLNVLFVELFMCSREDTVYLAESLLCVSGALGPVLYFNDTKGALMCNVHQPAAR